MNEIEKSLSQCCKVLLKSRQNGEKAAILARFFKTGRGQYGEGEVFLGIQVPVVREVVKSLPVFSFGEMEEMFAEPVHEYRLAGWMALVKRFEKAKGDDRERRACFEFASRHLSFACNWDLVDLTMPRVVGAYLLDRDKSILREWAQSPCLWTQRTAMVSTYAFMKKGHGETTLELAEILKDHPHDLMRKAVGWMLRECAKRVTKRGVAAFLLRYRDTLPRTTLRYAVERFPEEERLYLMGRREEMPPSLLEEGLC